MPESSSGGEGEGEIPKEIKKKIFFKNSKKKKKKNFGGVYLVPGVLSPGGVCSGGCAPGGGGCLLPGGSAWDTPMWTESHTPVKT